MEVAREYLERSLDTPLLDTPPNVTPEVLEETQTAQGPQSSSSYVLASDQSIFSRDVDYWMRGGCSPTESTGVQGSRAAVVQRSTITTVSTPGPGMWYILAMMLPLFSGNSTNRWHLQPSTILNSAELCMAQLGRVCDRARCHIRRLAQNQLSRELFATAMDVVLVVYAIGFLILSMYQASIIS